MPTVEEVLIYDRLPQNRLQPSHVIDSHDYLSIFLCKIL
jgi:hypothetical protein